MANALLIRSLSCLAPVSLALALGLASAAEPARAGGLGPLATTSTTFDEEFDGSSIDSTRWNTTVATSGNRWCPDSASAGTGIWVDISVAACHGLTVTPPYGSIAVGDGLASFSAPNGRSFGYIVAGPPARQPFPGSGSFVLELRMRYDLANVAGTGMIALATEDAEPVGANSPAPNDARHVFQVWNDGGGLRMAVLGSNGIPVADPFAFHTYRLEYSGGAYSLFVDDNPVVGPLASTLRPTALWFGNPVALWWGGGSYGPWTAFSVDFVRVTLPPPANTARPSVLLPGGAVDGSRIYASLGTWKYADSYAIDWRRCSGSVCQTVGHGSSYLLSAADLGNRMQLFVTASNAAGSTEASSDPTAPVQAAPPLNVHLPAISGTFAVGSTVTASSGSWRGTAPVSYIYEWFRCSTSGPCSSIPGATSSTYAVTEADMGHRLRVRVGAVNSTGLASAASPTLPSSSGDAPTRNIGVPGVGGTPSVGSTLQSGTGAWTGATPITFRYQWRRCTTAAATSCTAIAGATGRQYVPTAADVGKRLRTTVTAANAILGNRAASFASRPISD